MLKFSWWGLYFEKGWWFCGSTLQWREILYNFSVLGNNSSKEIIMSKRNRCLNMMVKSTFSLIFSLYTISKMNIPYHYRKTNEAFALQYHTYFKFDVNLLLNEFTIDNYTPSWRKVTFVSRAGNNYHETKFIILMNNFWSRFVVFVELTNINPSLSR